MTSRATWWQLALSSTLIFAAITGAAAQTYPGKPVRLVLPYAPGGIIDYVGRTLARRSSPRISASPWLRRTGRVPVELSGPTRSRDRRPMATRWC